jgi:hypothetical protein
MTKDKCKQIVISFLLIMIVSGCVFQDRNAKSEEPQKSTVEDAEITATATLRPTITPFLSPTILQTPTSDINLMDGQLPDLLLSVNRASRYECITQGSNEIWLASYPYDSPQPLLVSAEVDYRFPTWSPDGEWIAYVESRPQIIQTDTQTSGSGKISGSDTLWIVRPDGTDKRQVGDPLPSALMAGMMGTHIVCDVIAEIDPIIEWSPDGEYIIYIHSWGGASMQWNYSYYITEVSSGKTRALFTQTRMAEIYWAPNENRAFIHSDTDMITSLDVQGIDQIKVEQIALNLPAEVINTTSYEMIQAGNNEIFYGIFLYADDNNPNNYPNRAMIWSFELGSKQWQLIADVSKKTWFRTYLLPDQALICNEDAKKIKLLEKDSWEPIGVITLPSDFYFLCALQAPQEIHDKSGNPWIIIEGTQNETQTGLWAFLLQPDNKAFPQLIIDFASIPGNMNALSSYSFRPDR